MVKCYKFFPSILVISAVACTVGAAPYGDGRDSSSDRGIWVGPLNLSPSLDASVFYDSNPDEVNTSRKRLMEEAEDYDGDRYDSAKGFNIKPGLLLLLPGNGWSLNGNFYYIYEDDDSDYSRKPKDWLASLGAQGGTDGGLEWSLGSSAQQSDYQKFDEFSQEDRFALRFYGGLGKAITEKTKVNLTANYSSIDFDDEYAYDTESTTVGLGLSRRLSEKTDALVSLSYGINEADDEESEAKRYNASVGLGSRATEKITYRALVGVSMFQDYDYEDEDGNNVSSDDEYTMSYDLSMQWRPTMRLTVNLSGGTSYETAEDVRHNSLLASTMVCSADYRLFRRAQLSGGVAYRYEDYTRKVYVGGADIYSGTDEPEGKTRQDDQVNLFSTLTVGVTEYASVFVGGLYSETSSTIEDFDYDRYRVYAGIAMRY